MKTFQKWAVLFCLALAFHARAATNQNARFAGTVVDAQGQPVAGAAVDCYQYPSRLAIMVDMEMTQQTTTDSKGAFSFSAPHGMTIVVVKKPGLAPAWKAWQNAPEEATEPLVLAGPTELAGTVVDAQGQPVGDAEVWVSMAIDKPGGSMGTQLNYIFGKPARNCFSTRTGADGRFRFADFPPDTDANLAVSKPGKALRVAAGAGMGFDSLQARAGQDDVKLVLDPASSIEGKVTVRDTGQPLAHAKLWLQPAAGWGGMPSLQDVQSGADGTFLITDVAAGAYRVAAIFTNAPIPDWVAEPVPVTVAAGETVRDVRIQASKGGIVEVSVLAKEDQKPLANVTVQAYSEVYQGGGGSTGSNGVSVLRLPPGQYSIFVVSDGFSQGQISSAVAADQTNRVRLELNSPYKITGTIRDPSGAPLAGVRVAVFPNYGRMNPDAKTDSDGRYEVTWQQPAFTGMRNRAYYLVARSLEHNLAAVHDVDEKTTTLDLSLKPGMTVSARVEDAGHKAITNVTGYLMLQMDNTGFPVSNQPIRADDRGRIRIDALPLGERYNMNVSARGYGSSHQQMDAADPKADHYEFPAFTLKLADRKLAGRVLGSDGKPVTGAQVNLNGEGQPNGFARTEIDGHFTFDAVCEGPVNLWANFQGSSGNAEAMGGDTNVVIRLGANNVRGNGPSVTVTGTVVDPAGNVAVGTRLTVAPQWGMMNDAKTDTKGEYTLVWEPQQGMQNAKYFLIGRDLDRNLAVAEEIDDKKTRVDLRLQPGLSISGAVQDTKGEPVSRANVNINFMAGNNGATLDQQPIRVDASGAFTIAALPTGQQYNVYVSANGYGTANRRVQKTGTETNSIQLPPFKLKLADRQIAGQVLGADGKPLAGVQVMINGPGQPFGNTRSDGAGNFTFKQVCDGPINVRAYQPRPGPGPTVTGSAQAQGGDLKVVVKMGVNAPPTFARLTPLKEQPWTWHGVSTWPATHKTAVIVLLALQAALFLGTGAGVFWFIRRRGE